MAGRPKAEKPQQQDETDTAGLIKVSKGSEELYVHPSALAEHKRLGWKEA